MSLTLSIETTDEFGLEWPYRLETTRTNLDSDEPVSDASIRYLERWTGTAWEVVGGVPWDSAVDLIDTVCVEPATWCPTAAAEDLPIAKGEVGTTRVLRLFDIPPGEYRLRAGRLHGADPGGRDAVSEVVVIDE